MLINGILLILLSLLTVPSLLLAKKPDAKDLLDKLVPVQGWFGVIFCIWGIWSIISLILNIGWLGYGFNGMVSWVTWLVYAVVATTLGFILGYPLIVKYVLSKDASAEEKGKEVLAKLQPLQTTLGIVGLVLGVWCIACSILFVVG